MNQKAILIYLNSIESLFDVLNDEQLGRLLRLCVIYARGTSPEELRGVIGNDTQLGVAWAMYKPFIDRDTERYNAIVEKRREAGRKHTGNQYTRRAEQGGTNGTSVPILEQMEQGGTNGTNTNNNIKNNNNIKSDKSLYPHTREKLKALLTGENYEAWREALAMTHRSLTAEQIIEAINRAVDWCAAEGKTLDEATVKHYANKECAMLAARPGRGRSLDDRREAFRKECEALRGISNDGELVAQFFAYYSQPTQAGDALRFETFDAWDTATRFRLYLKSVNNGKY